MIFVIPIFNEEWNIARVVDRIALHFSGRSWMVVAVDDGSFDDTPRILDTLAEAHGDRIRIVTHGRNLGVHEALYTGFSRAADLAEDRDRIVCMEGDGTSDPLLLDTMLDRLDDGCDIVTASRFLPGAGWSGFPFHRRLISRIGNLGLRMIVPYPGVTDFSIFFRAYRAELVKRVIGRYGRAAFRGHQFSANAAFLFLCLLDQPRVEEVPHRYAYQIKQSASSFRVLDALQGYFSLLASNDVFGLRAVCRKRARRIGQTKRDQIPEQVLATGRTLCPECYREISSTTALQNGAVVTRAACPVHGELEHQHWADPELYSFLQATRSRTDKDPQVATRPGTHHLAPSKSVFVDLTSRCNLACTFCFARAERDEGGWEPTAGEILDALSAAPGARTVFLCGGEPTLRPDLESVVSGLRAAGYRTKLLTNGLALGDNEGLAALARAGLDWLCLQFDGLDPESSRRIRGRDLVARKRKVLEGARRHGLKVMLTCAIMKGVNLDEVDDILRVGLGDPQVGHIAFLPCSLVGRYGDLDAQHRTTPREVFDQIDAATKGRITLRDFLLTRKIAHLLYRLTGIGGFFQKECFFQTLILISRDTYFPVTRFANPLFALTHLRALIRFVFKIPAILRWDTGRIGPELKMVSMEHFHDERLLNLDQINQCNKSYLTPLGFLPFCYYNRIRDSKSK